MDVERGFGEAVRLRSGPPPARRVPDLQRDEDGRQRTLPASSTADREVIAAASEHHRGQGERGRRRA